MTPFERMLESTLFVAADRAQREWRPIAVECGPVAWTVRPASDMTPDGYERITIVPPGNHLEETILGVAKRINLARAQGQPVAAAVLRFFDTAPTAPATPLFGDALPAAVNSNAIAKQFGEPQMTPYTNDPMRAFDDLPIPSEIQTPDPITGSNAVRDIQDRLLALPSVQRWIEENGETANLGPGLPCAKDARRFIFPQLVDKFQRLIEERTPGSQDEPGHAGEPYQPDPCPPCPEPSGPTSKPPWFPTHRVERDETGRITSIVDPHGIRFIPGDGESIVEHKDGSFTWYGKPEPLERGIDVRRTKVFPTIVKEPATPAPTENCTLCDGPAPPCVSLCEKALRIPVEQPQVAPVASAPIAGPYAQPSPPARARRGKKAPAPGQGSLFD